MIKGFIFDLDGTLINTLYDLADSCNELLTNHDRPTHDDQAYQLFVGNGMKVLIERAYGVPISETLNDALLQEFKDIYERRYLNRSKAYDGVLDLLTNLNIKNIPIAVCTNKNQYYVAPMLDHYFPDVRFVEIIGERGDGQHKPNPHYPLQIAASMNLAPETIAFVGDSNVDILTGINAHMIPIGVNWGFRSEEELRSAGATDVISFPSDLLDKLKK